MLNIGSASVDITPRLGTEIIGYFNKRIARDIHDPLEASALVASDGATSVAVMVLDVIMLYRRDFDAIKARAAALSGIPAENMLVAAIHTHNGPSTATLFNTTRDDAYCAWACEKAADAIALAAARAEPAVMAHASGQCPEISFNRRWHMRDGSVIMHPVPMSPERVRPAGPTDPELLLAAFMAPDLSRPVSALVNFPLHYVGTPRAEDITADYAGVARRELVRMMGASFQPVYGNGCCGDIFWIDPDQPEPPRPTPYFQITRVGRTVASEAFRRWQQITSWQSEAKLGAASAEVPFICRRPSAEQLRDAEKMLAGPPDPDNYEWVYANELMRLNDEPAERPAMIKALRIGDVGIVGLPGEIFVEIGLAIRKGSPAPRTMVIELANDWLGYIPTDLALREGSYETRLATVSKAPPGTADLWINTALKLLARLFA
jgi:hypothetical protein